MAVAHHTVVSRWADRADTANPDSRLSTTGTNVYADGDRIYSYGSHFEMARILRESDGTAYAILINGDRYSSTTSQHQSMVRSAARQTRLPNIIVPYSALRAAGVDLDTVRPIHVQDDTYTYHPRIANAAQLTENTYRFAWDDERKTWRDNYHSGPQPEFVGGGGRARMTDTNLWRVFDQRHWLGEALLSARITEDFDRPATDAEIAAHRAWRAYMTHCDTLERAWRVLADELQTARTSLEDFYAPGGHRYNHWDTVVRRMPASVRQEFDDLSTRTNLAWEKHSAARYAQGQPRNPHVIERHRRGRVEFLIRETRKRVTKFLSAFDHNEARECYFLCELPRENGNAQTVDAAFESLKPKAVADAIASGLHVERQGDIFAIPTSLTTRELKSRAKRGTTIVKRGVLLTTNHTASEVIYTRDGDTYARGILRHEPGAWRTPDHARRKMGDGKTWHRILRNRVPLARTHYSNIGANQSGQSRAWTMGGSVD